MAVIRTGVPVAAIDERREPRPAQHDVDAPTAVPDPAGALDAAELGRGVSRGLETWRPPCVAFTSG
jgi:hypothetical protein